MADSWNEIAYRAGLRFMVENPDYALHSAASMQRLTDSIVKKLAETIYPRLFNAKDYGTNK